MKMTRNDILYLSPATPTLFAAIAKETLVHRNMLVFSCKYTSTKI